MSHFLFSASFSSATLTRRTFSHPEGPQPVPNTVQSIRAELGLTQNDLARLLNVSRSAVAMAERAARSLPWPNVLLLHALQTALLVPPLAPDTLPPPPLSAAERDDLASALAALDRLPGEGPAA